MKRQFFLISAVIAMASCSSPKYTYNFDHYNYNSGRKSQTEISSVNPGLTTDKDSPLIFSEDGLIASASPAVVVNEEVKASPSPSLKEKADLYKSMSNRERKEFRKELKGEIKNYTKELKSGDEGASTAAVKELDDELKLAIIFGAVGITLVVLGGINTIFWVLGVIGLVVGLVFFIRWISTQ